MAFSEHLQDNKIIDDLFKASCGSAYNAKILSAIATMQISLQTAYAQLKRETMDNQDIENAIKTIQTEKLDLVFSNILNLNNDNYADENSFDVFSKYLKHARGLLIDVSKMENDEHTKSIMAALAKNLGYENNFDNLINAFNATLEKLDKENIMSGLKIKGISFSGHDVSAEEITYLNELAKKIRDNDDSDDKKTNILEQYQMVLSKFHNPRIRKQLLEGFFSFHESLGELFKANNRDELNGVFLQGIKNKYAELAKKPDLPKSAQKQWGLLIRELDNIKNIKDAFSWLQQIDNFDKKIGRKRYAYFNNQTLQCHFTDIKRELSQWLVSSNGATVGYIKSNDENDQKLSKAIMQQQLDLLEKTFSKESDKATVYVNSKRFKIKHFINRGISIFGVKRYEQDANLLKNIMGDVNALKNSIQNDNEISDETATKFNTLVEKLKKNSVERTENSKVGKNKKILNKLKIVLNSMNKLGAINPNLVKAENDSDNAILIDQLSKYLTNRTRFFKPSKTFFGIYRPNFSGIRNSAADVIFKKNKNERESTVEKLKDLLSGCQTTDDYLQYLLITVSEVDKMGDKNNKLSILLKKQIYKMAQNKIVPEANNHQLLTLYRVLSNRYRSSKHFKELVKSIEARLKNDNQVDDKVIAALSVNEDEVNRIIDVYTSGQINFSQDKQFFKLLNKGKMANSVDEKIQFIINACHLFRAEYSNKSLLKNELLSLMLSQINDIKEQGNSDQLLEILSMMQPLLAMDNARLPTLYLELKGLVIANSDYTEDSLPEILSNDEKRENILSDKKYPDEEIDSRKRLLYRFEYKVYNLLSKKLAAFRIATAGVFKTKEGEFFALAKDFPGYAAKGLAFANIPNIALAASLVTYVMAKADGAQRKVKYNNISELLESDAMLCALSKNVAENLTKIWEYQIVTLGNGNPSNIDTFASCAVDRILDYLATGAYRMHSELPLELQLCGAVRTQKISHSNMGTRLVGENGNWLFSGNAYVVEDIFDRTPSYDSENDKYLGSVRHKDNIGAAHDASIVTKLTNMHEINDFNNVDYPVYNYLNKEGPVFEMDPLISKQGVVDMLHQEAERINRIEVRIEEVAGDLRNVNEKVDGNAEKIQQQEAQIKRLEEEKELLEQRMERLEALLVNNNAPRNRYSFHNVSVPVPIRDVEIPRVAPAIPVIN